jgi:hypothetical protein
MRSSTVLPTCSVTLSIISLSTGALIIHHFLVVDNDVCCNFMDVLILYSRKVNAQVFLRYDDSLESYINFVNSY